MTIFSFKPVRGILLFVLMMFSWSANAQGFSGVVSPPRFEADVKAGETYRNSMDFYNTGGSAGGFTVSTMDWVFDSKTMGLSFHEELKAGSCRQWVYLEAPELNMKPNSKKRYRFEVRVPKETPAQECRFAIMFSGKDPTMSQGVPVTARLAVIVYLRVGGAMPYLTVVGREKVMVNGQKIPALLVKNTGNASGRFEGYLEGKDSKGKTITFAPQSYPILPGKTDRILLQPQPLKEGQPVPSFTYPLTVKGEFAIGTATMTIDEAFDN